jgi:acyl dehydratase
MNKKPAELHFEDIEINDEIKFNVKITEEMIDNFAALSGDYNPMHTNQEYASNTDFGKKICHGMLLASFFSRLVGMYIPGKKALYFSQSLNFRNPCFINDEVTIIGIVIEKKSSTKMIKLKTIIKNFKEQLIVDGEAKVIVRN